MNNRMTAIAALKIKYFLRNSLLLIVSALAVGLTLTACGGGGSSTSANSPSSAPVSSIVSGVAATGAPLAATVTLKDATGAARVTTTSASDGSFSVDVTGLTAPFFLQAVDTSGTITLYSMSTVAGIANINPLSNLVVVAAAMNVDPSIINPSDVFIDPAKFKSITSADIKTAIATVLSKMSSIFQAEIQSQGASGVDPITDLYAIGNGLDKTFDALNLILDPATGAITENDSKTHTSMIVASVTDFLPSPASGTTTGPGSSIPPRTNQILYVSNWGRYDTLPGISAISTITNKLISTTTSYSFLPGVLAANPSGSRLYVANNQSNGLSVIDTSNMNVIATIPLGNFPKAVVVNSDGTRIYVANGVSNVVGLTNTVSVIDAATNTIITNVPLPYAAESLAINPTGTRLYATQTAINISVIDTGKNAVIASVTNSLADTYDSQTLSTGCTVNSSGTLLYVTSLEGIYVIDTATNTAIKNVIIGPGSLPSDVAVTPDDTRVFVVNNGSNTLSVIDTDTNTIIATVNVGNQPRGIVFNAAATQAYVADGYFAISVIDNAPATVSVIDTIAVPYRSMSLSR